jgi:hypothetical protein
MITATIKSGDVFLLFHRLPFAFDKDLPLTLGPNVYLAATPQALLDAAEPALTDFVLPGYHLREGLTNCCLRYTADSNLLTELEFEPKNFFFNSIVALRLYAPIGIEIGGQFTFKPKPEGEIIENMELFQLFSPWQPIDNVRYSGKGILLASEIATHLIQPEKNNCKRLMSALVLFSQVTCGLSRSWQLSYLGLFSALEALFAPKGKKATILAKRIANFLNKFDSDSSLEQWLYNEYIYGRSQLVHGIQDIKPDTKISSSKIKSFGKLHEISRLCILGFLTMDNNKLVNLSEKKGADLQRELDSLDAASGRFLQGQYMWLV